MAILIDIGMPQWKSDEDARQELLGHDPSLDVRTYAEPGDLRDVQMLAAVQLRASLPNQIPNLRLVQKLGAGVDTMLKGAVLPAQVRVARLRFEEPASEMAEYCLSYILRGLRNHVEHAKNQQLRQWTLIRPAAAANTTVGVLGLGQVGQAIAQLTQAVGFKTMGWSRTRKTLDGIACFTGASGFASLLERSDYVVAVLPSTPMTRKAMNERAFSRMKEGSTLINVGRGDLVDEPALLSGLETGPLAHAVLDVVSTEPLGPESPLWHHPKVTITPHNSAWSLGDGFRVVAENYRRLLEGAPLLNEIDRSLGY